MRRGRHPIVTTAPTQRLCEACGGRDFASRFEKEGHRYERCRGCGLERIHPPPSDAELAAIYGGHYYDAWGPVETRERVRALKQATFREVIAAAGTLSPRAKVLDCGAATGFLMEVAADLGYEPYGVELSSYGAQHIAARFGAGRVFEGHLEGARFPEVEAEGFAAIFMCDYLEHVRAPARVLGRAASLLRPGAPLVISTPRVGSLTQRVMGAGWTHYKTEHLYAFTSGSLRLLLEATGFVDMQRRPARKVMTIEYLRHQFQVYRNPLLTPVSALLGRLPRRAREQRFPIVMGEMLVVARRAPRPGGAAIT
jgi:SAM-dependent methyltransferase